MPTPDAIAGALKFRAALIANETAAFERMATIYAGIARRIAPEIEALAAEIADMETVTPAKLRQLDRLKRILRGVVAELTRFGGGTVRDTVELIQQQALTAGMSDALALIRASLPPLSDALQRQIMGQLTTLDPDALQFAAGLFGEDSPLAVALESDYSKAVADAVSEHIFDGITKGENPRRIAAKLTTNLNGAMGRGLTWALTTVRTAQVKSYQLANHATYQANANIVPQWEWNAALDDRTCLSCIAKHGTLHPVTETLRDHHNGRCAPLPVPISYAQLGISGVKEPKRQVVIGRDWFDRQPQAKQRQIMGAGRYEAWKKGEFDFADLSREYSDPVYGELFREASLKDLLGARAREYYSK